MQARIGSQNVSTTSTDDYAIRETVDAPRRAWREADPDRTFGGGMTLAGVMLHGWVRNARGIEFPKSLTWRPIDLPPAHMKGARRSDGRSLDP